MSFQKQFPYFWNTGLRSAASCRGIHKYGRWQVFRSEIRNRQFDLFSYFSPPAGGSLAEAATRVATLFSASVWLNPGRSC